MSEFDAREVTITRKGHARTFTVHEISHAAFSKLTANLNHQDAEKQRQARENFSRNLICATCYENGSQITFDQAGELPQGIANRLAKEAGEVNGTGETQADVKNV